MALLLFLLQGCSPASQINVAPSSPKEVKQESSLENAPWLYARLCRHCHNIDGKAQTPLAQDLHPAPTDLTLCNFKYRSTPSGTLPTDSDLLRTLWVGIPGTAMPAFSQLMPPADLKALVTEVKKRCDRFAREKAGPSIEIKNEIHYSATSAARGRKVYLREGCKGCHGEQGHGNGPAAAHLKDVMNRPIQPRDYSKGVFRSGFRPHDIARAFSTGLDGTPMPELLKTVSSRDRWNLANYILSVSRNRNRWLRGFLTPPSWYEPLYTWGTP